MNGMNGHLMNGHGLGPENPCAEGTVRNIPRAYIEILEQPASKALRFRYECEGRSAGSVPGVHSTPENKTHPKIRIVNHKGPAVIVVSCVSKDEPYLAHPHNLVGKEGFKKGICTVEINNEDMTATFQNLGIQCVKKKDIEEALKTREEMRVDPFRQGFAHKSSPSQIDLNAVRLCFQAFLQIPGQKQFNVVVPPVVSEPIYDKKAMSDLVITKLSHASGSVKGGQDMILLCEKVIKEDIEIVFFEEMNGQIVWDSKGDFTTNNVHKQVAIVFKTPPFKTTDIDHKVKVYIQLKRPSDKATSEAVPFFYTPDDSGYPNKHKRPKMQEPISYNDQNLFNSRSPQTPYTSPSPQPQVQYHIKQEPGRSPNYVTYGTSPVTPHYLATEYHPSSPYDLQQPQYSPSTSLPPFQTLSATNPTMNTSPIQQAVPTDYHNPFQVLGDLMDVNASTSSAAVGNLYNVNVDQRLSDVQVKHESAISLELKVNSEDLVQNLNCPIDAGQLSQNLSQSLNITDFPQHSANMTDSLSRIVNEKADECL